MNAKLSALAFAIAAFAGVSIATTANAVSIVANPSDFQVNESPGQYTVVNNSTSWYVYAFAVSNPAAALPGAAATTTFTNWNGLVTTLDLGTGTQLPVFAYASADADLSDITNPSLPIANLANYIAPGTSSDLFFWSVGTPASVFGMLLVDANGDLTSINGSAETPLPAALPLFASGLGALGLLGWRRKKAAALAA